MLKRLAIITSHPIQYNAPLFELLAKRKIIDVKVFYTWGKDVLKDKYDPDFGKVITWDIPLLNGYEFEFLENVSKDKGSHHFNGIDNPGIIDAINNYKPAAILVYGWSFKSHLKLMRHFKNKIPLLFRGDSNLLDKTVFISSLKRTLFLKWVYRFVDIALYVGKSNYDYFRKAGLTKNQLVFAPHVIDNARFACEDEKCLGAAAQFRKILNIPNEDFIFLFAGKLEPKKDPLVLIHAFLQANFNSTVHLVIIGNGVLENELKENYSQKTSIHFLDFQNQLQMPAVYQMADVFVLPSKGPGETWGLSVNEAMANGKPVVVSDRCGCAADLVEEGINGYTFNATNTIGLQKKLELLYANKNNMAMFMHKSKEKIAAYSLDALAGAIENTVLNIKACV
ncbi:MAG: glycosyltransferase family 4 protein [Ferruginibacter sp.]